MFFVLIGRNSGFAQSEIIFPIFAHTDMAPADCTMWTSDIFLFESIVFDHAVSVTALQLWPKDVGEALSGEVGIAP